MPTTRAQILVFLGLCGVFALSTFAAYEPYTFLQGDSSFYATVNRALLDGHLDQHAHQPRSWYEQRLGWNDEMDAGWSNIALGAHDEWWPKHPLLLPILGTPWFVLLGYPGLLLFNVLMFVTALWLAFRIASRWTSPEAAALAVMLLAMLPVFTRVAYSYSNDILYTVLGVAGVERWLAGSWGASGLCFGLAIVSKPTTAVLALPCAVALIAQRKWRPALRMAMFGAPPVLVWLAANWWMFGGPLVTSYNRILVRHGGQQALFDIAEKFHRPWKQGWHDMFFAPFEGLYDNAWLAFAGLLGLPWLARRHRVLAIALVVSMAGFFWLYVPFEYTYARFFLPWATLLAVPLAGVMQGVAGAAARLMPDEALPAPSKRGTRLFVTGVLLILAFAGWALRHRGAHRWQASRRIDRATVSRGGRVPCDYFNPGHQKWECASYEPEAWQRWGLALGDQCTFPDGSRGWLWLHPNPGAAKRIWWNGVPTGPLHVRYALAPPSRLSGLQLALMDGDRTAQTWTIPDVGVVHEVVVPQHGAQLGIEVPAQAHEWRQLCVDLYID